MAPPSTTRTISAGDYNIPRSATPGVQQRSWQEIQRMKSVESISSPSSTITSRGGNLQQEEHILLSDAPSHTGYSESEDSNSQDSESESDTATSAIHSSVTSQRLPVTPQSQVGTLSTNTSSIPVQDVPNQIISEDTPEDEEKWVQGASPFFVSLVKKIIEERGYPLEPQTSSVPGLLSDTEKVKPLTYRLPPNPYILGRLQSYRNQVVEDTAAKAASKHYPKPPASLERVAELGDPDAEKLTSNASSTRVKRQVPQPPDIWNYILVPRGTESSKLITPRIRLNPAQTKQMEMSTIWSLKGANYIDHFTHYQKHTYDTQKDKLSGIQTWAQNTGAPEEVMSVISDLITNVQEVKQVVNESQDIFKSIVNSLIFQRSLLEFARRDDLGYMVSNLVSDHTQIQLRNSKFDNKFCFDPEICEKARAEFIENDRKNPRQQPREDQQGRINVLHILLRRTRRQQSRCIKVHVPFPVEGVGVDVNDNHNSVLGISLILTLFLLYPGRLLV